ncbi:craniofacial development protein [Thalictrum thalictroides]|uniref:Craniofacial development protein n=1 Tax=Thalictrum thalictroides TaxID=46969 RepID=A0A7J6W1X3_THATH|nr:craniofacial development protein [Thalictrum thalictroides]
MVSLRTLRSYQQFYKLFKHQNPSLLAKHISPLSSPVYLSSYSNVQELGSTAKSFIPISFFQRNLTTCAELVNSVNVIEASSIEVESTDLLESNNNIKKRKKGKKHLKWKKGNKHLNGRGNGVVEKCENLEEKESSVEVFEKKHLKMKKEKKHLNGRGNGVVGKCLNLEEKESSVEISKKEGFLNVSQLKKRGLKENVQNTEKMNKKKNVKSEQPTVQPKPTSLHAIFTSKHKSLNSVNEKKLMIVSTVQPKPTGLHAIFTSKHKNLNSVNDKILIDDNVSTVSFKQEQVSSHVKPETSKKDKPIKVPTVHRKEHGSSQVKAEGLKKDKFIRKELPPEMISLVDCWYQEGYFNEAPISQKELDAKNFSNQWPRSFLKHVAKKFGQDHQEIAKWLSGSDLKTVALFGCPSVERKTVFAAKQLRSFFGSQEDIVCRSCQLKSSCKFVNQEVIKKRKDLNLVDAMRVLTSYLLHPAPLLVIANEVKSSIDKLVKEVVRLRRKSPVTLLPIGRCFIMKHENILQIHNEAGSQFSG